jgi:uncharacterized protein (DUF934 family)
MRIIRKREIVEDGWVHVADDVAVPAGGDVIVTLDRWRRERDALRARCGRLGVRVPNTLEPRELADDLAHFSVIAVHFPKYRDGRGFSLARLLRRAGYTGEIRAVGNVLRDQLYYMERCGFDTYEIQPGKSIEDALAVFGEMSVTYQDAADPRSVDRRRWRRPAG